MIGTEVIPLELLPLEAAKYAVYDSIIFNNVSGSDVGGKQMDLIEQAVRSFGIGFMMAGGEDSFGMGGYFKTLIEKAPPVSMELEGKREIPSLGLILVIDRSGSMDGNKIELAKESAMRTVELMRAKDTVGVVAFDDQPWWVVPPQKLGDKEEVLSKDPVDSERGGTNIYPAVSSALEEMLKIKTQRRHIILMTDGQSAMNSGYQDLTDTMVENKITMSSVAVGMDADTNLLQSLWMRPKAGITSLRMKRRRRRYSAGRPSCWPNPISWINPLSRPFRTRPIDEPVPAGRSGAVWLCSDNAEVFRPDDSVQSGAGPDPVTLAVRIRTNGGMDERFKRKVVQGMGIVVRLCQHVDRNREVDIPAVYVVAL